MVEFLSFREKLGCCAWPGGRCQSGRKSIREEKRWNSTWVLGARRPVPARNGHPAASLEQSCGCLDTEVGKGLF